METRNNPEIRESQDNGGHYSKTNTRVYYHERKHNSRRRTNTIILGLIIILAALLKIYFSLNPGNNNSFMNGLEHVLFSWPVLLIIVSLFQFGRKEWIGGTFMLLLGLVFLAPRIQNLLAFYVEPSSIWLTLLSGHMVICGAAICFGIVLILSALNGGNANHASHRREKNGEYFETSSKIADYDGEHSQAHIEIDPKEKVDYRFIFSGAEQYYVEPVFPGGTIKCVFGGMTLDLTHTNLAPGNTYLNIEGTFGGVQLKVPSDWQIEIRSNCVMGGFVDDRHFIAAEPIPDRKLIINAHCVFGGGNIE